MLITPGTIAIFGDVHGQQDKMVQSVRRWQKTHGMAIDLILCVGDFQALRDETDMHSMACPEKYMEMGDYAAYHSKEKVFPVEILFIGGNHEAYNLLDEYPQGGMICPNCYYMGRQDTVERHGLRIAGLSGIFSPKAYELRRTIIDWSDPQTKNNNWQKKRATYFTQEEVEGLAAIGQVDILLLHDWPSDLPELADPDDRGGKPRCGVGNNPARGLLETLKPRWLFCGHMHCYFRGTIHWPDGQLTTFVCLDQIAAARDRHMAVLHAENESDWRLLVPPEL